jgi:hypothetical protein
VVVSDYNKYMGGVDRADQRRANYGMNRKSRKWWHRLFWGMMDIAFVNAHVIYNKLFEEKTTLEFRSSISLGFIMTNKKKEVHLLGPSQKEGSIITASPKTFDLATGVVIGSFMKKYGADANCAVQKVCSLDPTANVQPVEFFCALMRKKNVFWSTTTCNWSVINK